MMTHKTLAELQISLQDFLLDKKVDADGLTLETPAFSKQERLQIYHTAYRLRLIDTLSNDYPALKLCIGEKKFFTLGSDFILQYPSHHPSLRWFGEKLSAFLLTHSDWKKHPEFVELAEFEWAQATAFDTADDTLATLDDLRRLPPETWGAMQLEFHSSLRLLHFFSNAPDQWSSLIKDGTAIAVEIKQEAQTWLLWREKLQVVYRPLNALETWTLQEFLNQRQFADVCGGLCEWLPEEKVPMQVVQYLQHWINSGLVTNIMLANMQN